jgi:hypothetical protein
MKYVQNIDLERDGTPDRHVWDTRYLQLTGLSWENCVAPDVPVGF